MVRTVNDSSWTVVRPSLQKLKKTGHSIEIANFATNSFGDDQWYIKGSFKIIESTRPRGGDQKRNFAGFIS